jgi:Cu/Ag efflux protein CusF
MINPGLSNKSEQDPQVISAQKELGAIQSKVRKMVLGRDDIDKVSWRIDKEWYAQKGIWIN